MNHPALLDTLQKYFGYSEFRPLQEQIIDDILQKKDVFVLMPTGGGKSLCYQLPSLLMGGTTIVISPLISLMKDQVDALTQNGVKAAYLNSSLDAQEQQDVIERLTARDLTLLYVAPERLVKPDFLNQLLTIPINFFAIDEAHCISQWGHDFRPEYRQLDLIRKVFSDYPVMALTATATPQVAEDIVRHLGLTTTNPYQASFNRPNLSYKIMEKNHAFTQTLEYVKQHKSDSGIIYCQSRKTVERVAEKLQDEGIRALPYHAGLDDSIRKENQEKFIKDDVDIVVATIAFGMGIDKPNVRYIIHYDLPKSIEGYYQETGRAGRDGLPSECLLLFSYGDKFFYERFFAEKDEEERRISMQQLQKMIDYAQSSVCRRKQLLNYFAEEFTQDNCESCDNCVSPKETMDGTILTQKILSCIYRTGGRFGTTHIIRILTGSRDKNVLSYGHDKLSTYGIVTDFDRTGIRKYIYELVAAGYIAQSDDKYGILSLTKKSAGVLRGNEKVFLSKPILKTLQTEPTQWDQDIDHQLFNLLRTLRKRLADEKNVPPYVVFSDASLKDMATYFPQTEEQFLQVFGVGEQKYATYGEVFLKEITRYCKSKNIAPKARSSKKPERSNGYRRGSFNRKYRVSWD